MSYSWFFGNYLQVAYILSWFYIFLVKKGVILFHKKVWVDTHFLNLDRVRNDIKLANSKVFDVTRNCLQAKFTFKLSR